MLKEKREIYRSRILKRAVSIISVYSSAMYYRAISLHYKHIYKVVINSILTVKGVKGVRIRGRNVTTA